jgi:leader peptidase (prepilin peptidase) / N-methyltransferase
VAESVFFATIFLAGLAAGSFLNVVIHRGPVMWRLVDAPARGDLMAPGSYCPACKEPLRAINLLPLASYVAQRGRCAACSARISPRYPLVEALGGVSALLCVGMFGWTPAALFAGIAALALIALAFIDLETGYLPDALTLPLTALGLVANLFGLFTPFRDALIGAAAGFLVFWAIGEVYHRIRGRDGLGLGDAKLLAAIGAWTGWLALPLVIFIAAAGTLVVSAARRSTSPDDSIPFGPGLCAAGFAVLFFGERLLSGL